MVKKSDSTTWIETLDFSSKIDDNSMIWDVNDFLDVLNASLAALASDDGISPPTVSFSFPDGKGSLDYSPEAGFANDYELYFNEPLYSIYHTFDYVDVVFDQDWFKLNLVDSGSKLMTTTDELQLSPVQNIFIKSSSIPLVYEYTPGSGARSGEAILTDFEFNGANRYPLQNISYTATSGQYRFHSLTDTSLFDTLQLQFFYRTYSNNSFPLHVLPSGTATMKLFFRPKH